MTLENCERLYKHYLDAGMKEEAANIKVNLDRKRARAGTVPAPPEEAKDGKKSKR